MLAFLVYIYNVLHLEYTPKEPVWKLIETSWATKLVELLDSHRDRVNVRSISPGVGVRNLNMYVITYYKYIHDETRWSLCTFCIYRAALLDNGKMKKGMIRCLMLDSVI